MGALVKKLKTAWLFITFMIGTAQLPATPKPKIETNPLPLTWADSLNQLAEVQNV
jgi:hypothetical protein